MAYGFDPSMLLQTQGVQVPDPVKQYATALSLGDLARRGQMQDMELAQHKRAMDAQDAYDASLPDLVRSGFTTDSIVTAINANPRAAGLILKESDARKKAALDQEKTGAETDKTRAETRKMDLAMVGGMAQSILSNPAAGARDLQTLGGIMQRVGIDPRAFGDPSQDPQAWLRGVAGASIEAAKQIELAGAAETRAETARNNRATETNQAGVLAETGRHNRATEGIQGGTLAETRRHNQASEGLQGAGNTRTGVIELRKEFNQLPEVQAYKAAVPMVESARNAPNTTAGDLDVIYAVGKALDPNSVVREGELNLVLKTGSPLERVLGQMGYIVGQGRLSPQQRQKLLNMLDNRVGELGRQYGAARTTYEKAADANGLPKDQIFVDIPRADPARAAVLGGGSSGPLQPAPAGSGVDYVYTPGGMR